MWGVKFKIYTHTLYIVCRSAHGTCLLWVNSLIFISRWDNEGIKKSNKIFFFLAGKLVREYMLIKFMVTLENFEYKYKIVEIIHVDLSITNAWHMYQAWKKLKLKKNNWKYELFL